MSTTIIMGDFYVINTGEFVGPLVCWCTKHMMCEQCAQIEEMQSEIRWAFEDAK